MRIYFAFTFFLVINGLLGQTPCGEESKNWHLEKFNTYISINIAIPDNDSIQDDTAATMEKILYFYNLKKEVNNIVVSKNTINFDVKDAAINVNKYGYKSGTISISSPISFRCNIQIGSGNYKLTVSNIFWTDYTGYGVDLNKEFFKKNGCLKNRYKKQYFSNLPALRMFLIDWSAIDSLKILPKKTENTIQNNLPELSARNQTNEKDILINNAGQCMQKSLNNTIGATLLSTFGSSILIAGIAQNSSALKVAGSVSIIGGLVCGINALNWQYKAANYLIKVAPLAVKITF